MIDVRALRQEALGAERKIVMKTACFIACWSIATALSAATPIAVAQPGAAVPRSDVGVKFVMHRIGNFRSEACCVGDFNNDGKLDVVAGPYLYLAPDFKPQKIRELAGAVDEKGIGYYNDFMNIAMDVDGDGWLDVVSCDWFSKRATWYRNPGKAGGLWKEHLIEQNGNFETGYRWDLLGSGRRDVILPSVQRTVWYERGIRPDGTRGFLTHVVSEKLMEFGVGVGDINGDGRPDIIRPNAWFEAPADPRHGRWIEHPLSLGGKDGKATHTPEILVYDVNGDGLPDIITQLGPRLRHLLVRANRGRRGQVQLAGRPCSNSLEAAHHRQHLDAGPRADAGRPRRRRHPGTDHRQAVHGPQRGRPRGVGPAGPILLQIEAGPEAGVDQTRHQL